MTEETTINKYGHTGLRRWILTYIMEHGCVRSKDIRAGFGVSAISANSAIKEARRLGFLERDESVEGKEKVYLITPLGEKWLAQPPVEFKRRRIPDYVPFGSGGKTALEDCWRGVRP